MAFADLVASVDRAAQKLLGGVPVTYTPEVGSPVSTTPSGDPLIGMFDTQYVLVKASAETGVETVGPAVFLRLEDLPADPDDDEPTLTIAGVDYKVISRLRDDMGGILLGLRTVS